MAKPLKGEIKLQKYFEKHERHRDATKALCST